MPQQLSAETWPSIVAQVTAKDQLVGAAIQDGRPELYVTDDGIIEGSICFASGFNRRIADTRERVALIRGEIYSAFGETHSVGRVRLVGDGDDRPPEHRRRPAPAEPVKAKPRTKVSGKKPKVHRTPSGDQYTVPPLGLLIEGYGQEIRLLVPDKFEEFGTFEALLRAAYAHQMTIRFVGEYSAYLQSDYWRKSGRRLHALERAEHRCAVCNADGRLDVHHRCYDRLGFEADSDLIALCRACHERHHGKRGSAA